MATAIFSFCRPVVTRRRHQGLADFVRAANRARNKPLFGLRIKIIIASKPAFKIVFMVAMKGKTDHDATSSLVTLAVVLHDQSKWTCVLEVWHLCAGSGTQGRIDIRDNNARIRMIGFRQDLTPWRDDHRVAIGLAAILMNTALSRRNHKGAIFDGTGALQHVPMRLARLAGEGGRCRDDDCAGQSLGAEQLRETHIVADGKTESCKRQVDHDRIGAGA